MADETIQVDYQLGQAHGADGDVQTDVASAINAEMFGAAVLKAPDWKARAIMAQATFVQRLPGISGWTIGNGAGPVTQKAVIEERDERDEANLVAYLEAVEDIQEQQEQEREDWARQTHALAGIEMTGEDWQALGSELKEDGPLRQWLLDRIVKDGRSQAEAAKITDRVASVADIMAKPEGQRTPEEKATLRQAERDPALRTYLEEVATRQHAVANGPRTEQSRTMATGSMVASVSARADELNGFTSAPDLAGHFLDAQRTAAPLDTSRQPEPQQPAPTSAPVAASGFEI